MKKKSTTRTKSRSTKNLNALKRGIIALFKDSDQPLTHKDICRLLQVKDKITKHQIVFVIKNLLADRTIKENLISGRIIIEPLGENAIQPSSVDLRIDSQFRVFKNHSMGIIDVKENLEDLTELVTIDNEESFVLHPGEFVLGSTLERVVVPEDLVARLEGKSSLGRLGLLIHSTAGFVDAGCFTC